MKKITLLGVFLLSVAGFSQTNKQKIQAYFENNLSKYALTSQDISDLNIRSEVYGNGTKVTSCRVVQRYQGTDLYHVEASVAVKNGEIFRVESGFMSNIASKVNTVHPSLSVTEAIARAYSDLGVTGANFSTVETADAKTFTLSDGLQEDQIMAKLVYYSVDKNSLKLAWHYDFYQPGTSNYWTTSIDATNGQILEKTNQLLSCNVGNHNHGSKVARKDFNFTKNAFNTSASMLEAQGGSYRVIPFNIESPNHGAFQLISNPEYAASSPNGWHNGSATIGGTTPATMYTTTRGNNVWAKEDANGNNETAPIGVSPDGGATLNFDFTYGGESAQPTSYTEAATTNLFYMVNVIHDIWYQYGFNEASANFQWKNFGLGGAATAAGDFIQADAQDGYAQTTPTLNNANFTPTSDGARPRVQMFMWNAGAPATEFITVNAPASIAGPRVATTNVFEGTDSHPVPTAPNGIIADLVHYVNPANNGTVPAPNPISVHNACVPPTNAFDISGKIALIRRGNCNFSNKVKNAQDAGALAVIVYDTVPDNPVRLSMSSTGLLGILIPAVFVTKEIGEEMVAAMATETVNVKLEIPANLYLYADGDFDNVIIGHEIGHGISNRLIGAGLAGCMTNAEQMGEGWSDWFGLILQMKTGDTSTDAKTIGTYAFNEDPTFGDGLRAFPYSTDMTVNPRTFADSNWPVPADPADTTYRYVVGEFWASVLWDLTWAFVDQYGFDPNIYTGTGGNNKFMQLMVDAMKMGPTCNTSNMVGFRDIIFAADQAANGNANYNMIAEVFRKRGMGLNASSGLSTDSNDQTEDFTAFPLATQGFTKDSVVRVYPNPSNAVFNVRIAQFTGAVSMQVVDLNGRVVFAQNESNFNVEKSINLGHLSKGVYILKVNTSDFNYSDKIILK
jgi:extracellular elastinolytic metalloproteinase